MVRDKVTGRILSTEEQDAAEAAKKEKEVEEQHLEWRGGLAQTRAAEERVRAMQAEVGPRALREGLYACWVYRSGGGCG